MRLWVGKRVLTPRGLGRVVAITNARDEVRGHGKPIRGTAWVTVDLETGGRSSYAALKLKEVPP